MWHAHIPYNQPPTVMTRVREKYILVFRICNRFIIYAYHPRAAAAGTIDFQQPPPKSNVYG